jgi:hypothetical protein
MPEPELLFMGKVIVSARKHHIFPFARKHNALHDITLNTFYARMIHNMPHASLPLNILNNI